VESSEGSDPSQSISVSTSLKGSPLPPGSRNDSDASMDVPLRLTLLGRHASASFSGVMAPKGSSIAFPDATEFLRQRDPN
jgi:hypothetical protein